MFLKRKARKKRKKNKILSLLRFFVEVLLLMALSVVLFLSYKYYRMKHIKLTDSDTYVSSMYDNGEEPESLTKMFMILFLDEKELDDILLLANVNEENGEIRIVALDSESEVYLEDGRVYTCNEMYIESGAQLLMSTLNQILGLSCTDYFSVKSEVLTEMTDLFGGVEISLSEGEADGFSEYLSYNGEGGDFGPGIQLLTGTQALLYCREAKDDWSADTLDRLAAVAGQIWKKSSEYDIRELNEISDQFMYKVSTSISFYEFLNLLRGIGKYHISFYNTLPYNLYGTQTDAKEKLLN